VFEELDLNGKSILISGGTGSFGQHMVSHLLDRYDLRRLVVLSRDEAKQSDMAMRWPSVKGSPIRYFIGDVRDQARLEMAMQGIDIVVHAAALKQVPAAEYNPFECIRTNVMGAENIVQAAIRSGVKQVIALSTDKAANPVNLYGASKLASDKIFVAANNLSGQDGPRFAVVRYGNVIGSRGSVVPLFKRLVEDGATLLPITDDRMTRFVITLDQGVRFVLNSLSMMDGGEIFVPRIPSVRVVDVASAMAPALEQKIVGIRPGEKLHEVMITDDDARDTYSFDDFYVIEPSLHDWDRQREPKESLGGQRIEGDFRYASDSNSHFLSVEEIRVLLGELKLLPVSA